MADYRTTSDLDYLQRVKLDSRQQISFGLGARVIPIYDPIVVSGLTFTPIHRTDQLYTAFFQDEIALVPERLTLTIGTKLLHTNFTEFEPEPGARLASTLPRNQTVWASFTHSIRTFIQNIEDGTRRMRELLADLLAYAEIGTRLEEPAQPLDLNLVVQKV